MKVFIRLAEALGPRFAGAFEDMDIQTETLLSGEFPDRAALHGVLGRVRDLDLTMLSVRIEESPADA